jgi:putative hydrolase of the HAD superfamily
MIGHRPTLERQPRPRTVDGARRLSPAAISRLLGRRDDRRAETASARRRGRRGLILDLDDTLYPRASFVRSGFAAVARHVHDEYGVAAADAYAVMTRASARGRAGAELQAVCDRFALPAGIVPALVDVMRTHLPTLVLPADTEATLRQLRARGWAMAILTNGLPSVQFRKVAALGAAAFVDEVIYAEEHAAGGKPAAAPFRAALRALDLGAADCVCVGDDPRNDVQGARALGIATIRVARPGIHVDTADEADHVIDSIRMLPDAAALLLSKVTADVA